MKKQVKLLIKSVKLINKETGEIDVIDFGDKPYPLPVIINDTIRICEFDIENKKDGESKNDEN
ncbi:MAG: hypothetical protein J7L26_12665 [Candidatus Aminicenantes bacterium]|nr:hypothetical protein [Candidatus Aminicenantes bacterium]